MINNLNQPANDEMKVELWMSEIQWKKKYNWIYI